MFVPGDLRILAPAPLLMHVPRAPHIPAIDVLPALPIASTVRHLRTPIARTPNEIPTPTALPMVPPIIIHFVDHRMRHFDSVPPARPIHVHSPPRVYLPHLRLEQRPMTSRVVVPNVLHEVHRVDHLVQQHVQRLFERPKRQ